MSGDATAQIDIDDPLTRPSFDVKTWLLVLARSSMLSKMVSLRQSVEHHLRPNDKTHRNERQA